MVTSGRPSPSYSMTLRIEYPNRVGMLGQITSTIGAVGGSIGAVDIVQIQRENITRDITVDAANYNHGQEIVDALRRMPDVRVVHVSDRTFLMHLGGKLEVTSKYPVTTRADLSMVYTPGVARVCQAIQQNPESVYNLTIKQNTIAIVTDGSAVLGLGNIGPRAALPVMEGKAMLFKEFAGVDAFPLCLDTQQPDEIVATVKAISPGFGGINLEDIAAPRCFEVEERLAEELDIPVFHDDQHGTAVVVLAALFNALKVVEKSIEAIKVVINGAGAAGTACAKLLIKAGVHHLILCDSRGTIHPGRTDLPPMKRWIAEHTNPDRIEGELAEALRGADVFVGVSKPGVLTVPMIQTMASDPIVFAMANPIPEILPDEAMPHVRIMATGRSDYPNQINNVLCFPGFFRGVLDCRARRINDEMKLAAAQAIASIIRAEELHEDYIIPSVFDRRVVQQVARVVIRTARQTGVARRRPRRHPEVIYPG